MTSRKLALIFILTLLSRTTYACSCREIDDYFYFFKHNKSSFVGKVILEYKKDNYSVYSIEVLNKLSSTFHDTVTINNKNNAIGCTAYFEVGQVYLLTPSWSKEGYNIDHCDFIENSDSKSFQQDTALIRLVKLKNVFLNCSYFKGEIRNGKRNGKWDFFYGEKGNIDESGTFVNGKKNGEWIETFEKTYYKNGRIVRSLEILDDSTKITVETIGKTQTMFYSNGNIFKIRTKSTYTAFYPSGKTQQKARIRKRKYIVGEWVLYNENGTAKDRIVIPKENNYYEVDDIFYYHHYNDNLPKL